jgi:hypothetical protein
MIKLLAFLEADLPRIENEVNQYMDKYDLIYVHSTGSRLVFILKEKVVKRNHHAQKES